MFVSTCFRRGAALWYITGMIPSFTFAGIILCHIFYISYHIISYHIISYHIISYHIISYHITSFHMIWYDMIYDHCYVTWCPLTIPVVKGRCARDALPHAFHIGVFKVVRSISAAIKHIYKNLQTLLKVVMLLLTTMIAGISNKRCQWL